MIIIDRRKLRFLQNGRVIKIDSPRPYAKNRDYACGHRQRHQICRVTILDCLELEPGAYQLEIRQHFDIGERYLARNPGAQRTDYVHRPSQALRGEGAVIDAQTLNRYAKAAYERWDQLRREQAANRPKSRKHRYAP